MNSIDRALSYIRTKTPLQPAAALVLGSGLGPLGEEISDAAVIPYAEIPGFPVSTAPGHAGRLVIGFWQGLPVVAMQGRFHYYEGYELEAVTLPIRLFTSWGIRFLLLTNAAGGVNDEMAPGDLMLITDHINMTGLNPLRGQNLPAYGPRFPDMSTAYTPELNRLMMEAAKQEGLALKTGTYAWFSGPSFETPAEIRMLRTLGADAVGMSTVPEVITACHGGLRVAAISCISNMAAGILDQPITEEEVIETGRLVKAHFRDLLSRFMLLLKEEYSL